MAEKKLGKVPNQNNLTDIIKSQIVTMTDVVEIIVKAATKKTINYSASTLSKLALYSMVTKSLFKGEGAIMVMIEAINTLTPISNKKLKMKSIKKLIDGILELNIYLSGLVGQLNATKINEELDLTPVQKVLASIDSITNLISKKKYTPLWVQFAIIKHDIKRVIKFAESISKLKVNPGLIADTKKNLDVIKGVFKEVQLLFDTVSGIKVTKFIGIKLLFATLAIWKLLEFCKVMTLLVLATPIMLGAQFTLIRLNAVVKLIESLFATINATKINLKTFIKLKLLGPMIEQLIPVLQSINLVAAEISKTSGINDSTQILIVFSVIKAVFTSIKEMPVGIFMRRRLRNLNTCILRLTDVIKNINKIRITSKTFGRVAMLQLLVTGLAVLFTTIIIASPAFLLGSIAIWVLVGAVWVLKFAIKFIAKALTKMANIEVILGLLALTVIMGFITALALMLMLVALVAQPVVKASLWILALFGIITVVTLLTVGIGLLAVAAIYVLGPAIGGLALLTLTIVMIGAIALILKGIESINLDREKIQENVKTVIDCSLMVIDTIFHMHDDEKDEGSKKGFFATLISFVGGTLGTIVQAIMAIHFLALTMVAICIVMLIAAQLRVIQELDLDPAKIRQNVGIVINTAMLVVDTIFNRPDVDGKESNKSWIVSLIENFGGTLFTIVKAILAVAFLSIVIAAISFVLLIAAQLRLLQALNLDSAKIRKNVDVVINTAISVVSMIFSRPDVEGQESKKSWIVSLLEFVGGPIVRIAGAIMAVSFLAISIAMILLITILAKQLQKLAEINLPKDITAKVNQILIGADQVVQALKNRKDTLNGSTNEKKKGFLSRFFSNLGGAVDMIASMTWVSSAMVAVGMVSQLAEHLKSINSIPDIGDINTKFETICGTADNIIRKMNSTPDMEDVTSGNSRLKLIDHINLSINKLGNIPANQVKTINTIFDDYTKFIDKVNTVDVQKLETSSKMFEQMARFSESIRGNFDKLAASLSEDLMPVLEELKDIMEKVPEKLDTGFQNTSASIAATTAIPNESNVAAQVSRENPSMNKQQVDQLVQQRLKDYSKKESNGVASKLDELINLLKGYSGERVQVQTV